MTIPFSRPHILPSSAWYLIRAFLSGNIAGGGKYTTLCHRFFEEHFGFRKAMLTTSCTDALEMAALLTGIGPGDEAIMPSFTFPSTANAFLLRGAAPVFCDTLASVPNLDHERIESLITPRTRVIVVQHYGGLACEMDRIMQIASGYGLLVVENAAHALESYYKDEPLGSIGHLGAFSFHENMNIHAGEGGMLTVNHEPFAVRAEVIRDNGTARSEALHGEAGQYDWLDIGYSCRPPDSLAAFLWDQIRRLRKIQRQRKWIWWEYHEQLHSLEMKGYLTRPVIPGNATVNGNMFYITVAGKSVRDDLRGHLTRYGIQALPHYFPLHTGSFFKDKYKGPELPNTRQFSETLLRLPFYHGMGRKEIRYVVRKISDFFTSTKAASPE